MGRAGMDYRMLFTVALVRALDTRRLTPAQGDMLANSGSMDNFINILRDTGYRVFLETVGDIPYLQEMGRWRRDLLYDLVFRFSFDHDLASLLTAEYDFHNIKMLLREKLFNLSIQEQGAGWGKMGLDFMREVFAGEEYHLLPGEMEEAVREGIEAYYIQKDIMAMDAAIDNYCYKAMAVYGKNINSYFIRDHLVFRTDRENIRTVLRALRRGENKNVVFQCMIDSSKLPPHMLVESAFGEKGDLNSVLREAGYGQLTAAVEKYNENPYILEKTLAEIDGMLLRETDYQINGGEPLYAYVLRVEHELSVLGAMGAMTMGKIDPETIRNRVPQLW